MRHLLEVGWDIRIVADEVSVVELDIDNVLDIAGWPAELAVSACVTGDEDARGSDYRYRAITNHMDYVHRMPSSMSGVSSLCLLQVRATESAAL